MNKGYSSRTGTAVTLRQVRDLPFPLPVQGEAVSSWGSEGRAQQRTKGTGSPPPVNLVGPPLLATAVRRQLTGPGRLDIQSKRIHLKPQSLTELASRGLRLAEGLSPLPSSLFLPSGVGVSIPGLPRHCVQKRRTCLVSQVYRGRGILPQKELHFE